MKIGVVDVGGGFRGIYAAGVLDYPVLQDNPMEFFIVAVDTAAGRAKYFNKVYQIKYKVCLI